MANIINITESANRLEFSDAYSPIVCGNSNYYLHFTFDEIWKRCERKTALFVVEGKKMYVDFEGEDVRVPVLPNASFVFVSLISGEGNNQIATTSIKIRLEPTALGGDMSEFDQLSSCLPKVYAAVNDLQNGSIVAKQAENANFASEAVLAGTANLANEALVAQNVSNPNLLINGEFRVNQRGLTTYTFEKTSKYVKTYTVDRWYFTPQVSQSQSSVVVNNNSITLNCKNQYDNFGQFIEDYAILQGKTITVSAGVKNISGGSFYLRVLPDNVKIKDKMLAVGENSFSVALPTTITSNLKIMIVQEEGSNNSIEIEYIKLELGTTSTPNTPRPYAQELAMCQRYYQKISNTYMFTVYTASNKGLYWLMLSQSLRTLPTVITNGAINIMSNYSGVTYSTASISDIGLLSDNGVRLEMTFASNITAQTTICRCVDICLDSEIY